MNTPPRLRLLYLALAVVLPWSAEFGLLPGSTTKIMLPAELLIAVIAVLLPWHINPVEILRKNKTLLWVSLGLGWGWVCAAFSALPLVSVKYMLVATACWWVFLLPSWQWRFIFQEAMPVFMLSLVLADIRLLAVHGIYYGFRADQANLPGLPFFDDHNLSGALNVMAVFVLWAIPPLERHWQSVRYIITSILLASIVTSTSRGAIVSLAGGGMVLLGLLYFRHYPLLKTAGIFIFTGCFVWIFAGKNIQQAIEQDVSVKERINRYHCAIRMVHERPLTGFGPGTFALTYHPFQLNEEKTRISLDQPLKDRSPENYGRGGGAHSEYLQALAETGYTGLLLLCLFWGIFFVKSTVGIKFVFDKTGTAFLVAGMVSYLLHGIINNFFHDVRITFVVWVIVSRLMADDIHAASFMPTQDE